MSFEVDIARSALRELGKMPPKIRHAILETILSSIAVDPVRAGTSLHGELSGLRSARRGTFRIVYAIDDERRVVTVVRAQHRARVYRWR